MIPLLERIAAGPPKTRPCKKCPYRKDSPQGYTTSNPSRQGFYEATRGVLAKAEGNETFTLSRFYPEKDYMNAKDGTYLKMADMTIFWKAWKQ